MDNLDTATKIASWFDDFLKHGSIISVLLSLFFGWGFSLLASFPLHRAIKDDEMATWCARVTCVGGSFFITLMTWANEFRGSWALTMGVLSPLLGLALLWLLGKWKPDLVSNVLTMKKVTPPSDVPPKDYAP